MKVVLGDVAVVVKDAKASAKWWKSACGFEIRDNEGHWITVAPPGAQVVIHLCEAGEFELDPGNTGIGFFVDDVAAVEKAWRAKGVRFSVPRLVGEASVQARFLDPDGNEYWLFEDTDLSDAKSAKGAKGAKAVKKGKAAKKGGSAKKSPAKKGAAKKGATKARGKKRAR